MTPSCETPLSWEELVAYWAGDLPAARTDAVDEHLMGCGPCSESSARVAAITETLRELIPPVIDHAALARLRAGGARIVENPLLPGERRTVIFPPGVDLLIHRLGGLDLSDAQSVSVTVTAETTGQVLMADPRAPFDPASGEVIIACQRHFATMPADIVVDVRAFDAAGIERRALYPIPHRYELG